MRVVIAGAGEVGRHLAGMLARGGHDVVLVDRRAEVLAAAEEQLDVRTVQGEVVWRSVMERAGVPGADAFVAVTGADEANALAAALARVTGARLTVARLDDPGFLSGTAVSERGVLGVAHLLCRPRLTASLLLTMIAASGSVLARTFSGGTLQAVAHRVRPPDPVVGREYRGLAAEAGAWLGAVARDGFVRRPETLGRVEPGDLLVLAGAPDALATTLRTLTPRTRDRHVVVGGSTVGALVAEGLAGWGARVELIEQDRARAQELARALPDVRVLRGDATDLAFLQDIRLEDAARVVAAAPHDEVNLLVSMLVRQLTPARGEGPRGWAAMTRPGYAELCRQVGIEGTVSTFELLAGAIVEAIQPAGSVTTEPLPDHPWVIAHLRLPQAIAPDLDLSDLPLPAGALPLVLLSGGRPAGPQARAPLHGGDELLVLVSTAELPAAIRAVTALRSRTPS